MRLENGKFERFIKDEMVRVFTWKISCEHIWTRRLEERTSFEIGLKNFMEEFEEQKRKAQVEPIVQ